jgi:hypothetical protein
LKNAADEKTAQRLLLVTGTILFRDSTTKAVAQSLLLDEICQQVRAVFRPEFFLNFWLQVKAKFPCTEIAAVSDEVIKTLYDEAN